MRLVIITQGISPIVRPLSKIGDPHCVGFAECASRGFKPLDERKEVDPVVGGDATELRSFCGSRDLPYFFFHRFNMELLAEWLRKFEAELVIVYSMSQLLPENILSIPRHGVLNLHPSLLPAYRGPNPLFWIYRNGDTTGGVTLHYVDAGEDTGDIVQQKAIEIERGNRMGEIIKKFIGVYGVSIILETIETLAAGRSIGRAVQPMSSPTKRARNIRGNEYRALVDWDEWPVERLWHFLRGTEIWLPSLGLPQGLLRGVELKIGGFHEGKIGGPYGELRRVSRQYCIACANGWVEVKMKWGYSTVLRLVKNLLQRYIF